MHRHWPISGIDLPSCSAASDGNSIFPVVAVEGQSGIAGEPERADRRPGIADRLLAAIECPRHGSQQRRGTIRDGRENSPGRLGRGLAALGLGRVEQSRSARRHWSRPRRSRSRSGLAGGRRGRSGGPRRWRSPWPAWRRRSTARYRPRRTQRRPGSPAALARRRPPGGRRPGRTPEPDPRRRFAPRSHDLVARAGRRVPAARPSRWPVAVRPDPGR